MTVANVGYREALEEEREYHAERKELLLGLLASLAAAVTKRGKPVYTPAQAVARAVAVADALDTVLFSEQREGFDALAKEYEADDEAAE